MAVDPLLIDRIRNALDLNGTEYRELKMMGGLCFMVDDKMLAGSHIDKKLDEAVLMARVGAENFEACLEIGAQPMDMTGKVLKGFVIIPASDLEDDKALKFWIDKCLEYNPLAKKSKKKSKKKKR